MVNVGQGQVSRILYKEIVEGDVRKIHAQSNDSDSGGGARDFRFGSYSELVPIITLMFPNRVKEMRKRGGASVTIDVFQGQFSWHNAQGNLERKVSIFEPPTDVRPSEGRIARVHEYGCFDTRLMPMGGEGNRVLLLLIQLVDDTVWPFYAEERSLRKTGTWDPIVASEIVSCIDAERPSNRAIIGFRDFVNYRSYCNGK